MFRSNVGRRSHSSILAISVLLFIPSLQAQKADEELETLLSMSLDDFLQIKVKSASKFDNSIERAPAIVNVISSQKIEDYAWRSINDVLYRLPGFGPGQDFDRPTVPTRGAFDSWSNNHLLHLLDGIPINDNLYGTAYTWEVTPLNWISSLEVIRGPGSSLYGSNATNGVIQMNTLTAAQLGKRGSLSISFNNQGERHIQGLAGVVKPNYDLIVGVNQHNTDGNEYWSADGSGRQSQAGELAQFETRDTRQNQSVFAKLSLLGTWEGLTAYWLRQDWEFETMFGWLWWIPDESEDMQESRNILALKYTSGNEQKNWEYVLRYQQHDISWDTQYYPINAFDGFYPDGARELLNTSGQDLFARIQYRHQRTEGDSILIGLEGDYFKYDGDDRHLGNFDVESDDFAPYENGDFQQFGPWLDYILDEPLLNTAIFGQYVNRSWSSNTEVTLGLRLDRLAFKFRDIQSPDQPMLKRSFSKVSPRVAIIHQYNPELVFKFIVGQAFRAPMPTELAGAHTFSLASNIKQLEPEELTTLDAAIDWRINEIMSFRGTLFWNSFDNQIAYSTANNNLSTNVFSQDTRGAEAEWLIESKHWSGFFNLSYTEKINETILDNTISLESDKLTWEPKWKANFGLTYKAPNWLASIAGHYHGEVERRASDTGEQALPGGVGVTLNLDEYRPITLNGWYTIEAHLRYQITSSVDVGVYATNVFDTRDNILVKTGPFPFDYQQDSRRTRVYVDYRF